MIRKVKDFNTLIPHIARFLATGTDYGSIILMLKNAGFEVSFEMYANSKRSKEDFIHELFINQEKSGNTGSFARLADLILVKEYFRPGEYTYTYNPEEADGLSKEIKACLKKEGAKKPISAKEFRALIYKIFSFHGGLDAVSKDLFVDGHYEQAVDEACKFLENYIQDKIGDKTSIGLELMSKAFAGDNPLVAVYQPLEAKEQKNEQRGLHALMSGEVQFIKNRLSHKTTGTVVRTRDRAIKILSFISFLLESIDECSPEDEEEEIPF